MIEIYPRGTELHEAEGGDGAIGVRTAERRHTATHIAIATALSEAAVLAICGREGWTAKYCGRGGVVGVIEIFAEGCQMMEVLPPEMQREYVAAVTIDNWRRMIEARPFDLAA